MKATALIAEDEPLLARALQAELARAWPGLQILTTVADGASAVAQALALRPDVLFLDIRMPGLSGLQAAAELADEWPHGDPLPALVFVTAYDAYAVEAFEREAVDYVLKPVQPGRLARTVQRLQHTLAQRRQAPGSSAALDDATLARLRALLLAGEPPAASVPRLRLIPASVGQTMRMVPVDEVLVFEAADKYVRVLTADAEVLIRTPLKNLLPRLDPDVFWQIHRGTVVRAAAIDSVTRDEAGRLHLCLRGRAERLAVSRLYAERFRAL
jgi:DNA-binding LytR/AlgR family response regulator